MNEHKKKLYHLLNYFHFNLVDMVKALKPI